jgi:hypothetical protein
VTECTGPKRVKKFKDMANEFFNPYEEVLDNMYDALILAMTLGIDVSDTIMLLSGACNIWGKYLCDTCRPPIGGRSEDTDNGVCECNTENNGSYSNCYYRVKTDKSTGRVLEKQPHCRLVGTIGDQEKVWHEWIDANSGITGSTQVACASDMIDNVSLFRNRRKKTSVDIDTLRDLIAQDSYACRTPTNNDGFDVLKHCGANRCNVSENDSARYSQLIKAVNTRTLPAIQTTGSPENRLCFNDEKDFDKFDNGGSSNSETESTKSFLSLSTNGQKTGTETWQNKYLPSNNNQTKEKFNVEVEEINCFSYRNSPLMCENTLGKCKWENNTCVPNAKLNFGL